MKKLFLTFIFCLLSCSFLMAQEDEYYKPSYKREDVPNNVYANLNRKAHSLYVVADGGMKFNKTTLNNDLDGLLKSENSLDFYWGFSLGYAYDNRWAIETGYLQNPVFYKHSIANGRGYYSFNVGQKIQSIPLRFRYRVVTLDAVTKTATLFVGAGVLLGIGVKNEKNILSETFIGYRENGSQRDTLQLITNSFLSNKAKAMVEFQSEIQGKIANGFYISLYARATFSPKSIVRTEVNFFDNSTKIASAYQELKPLSYNFGLKLRCDIAKGYKYLSKVE